MSILYLLVPIALLLAGVAVWAFTWAVKSGQFEDTQTPAYRVLWDDEEAKKVVHETNGHASDDTEGPDSSR